VPRRLGWARRSGSWRSSSCWWREKGVGTEWPSPAQGGCGHQAGLLALLEQALRQGWTARAACQALEVSELRIYRWLGRPARRPGARWQPDARPAGVGGR
jgi:hypothetical protein